MTRYAALSLPPATPPGGQLALSFAARAPFFIGQRLPLTVLHPSRGGVPDATPGNLILQHAPRHVRQDPSRRNAQSDQVHVLPVVDHINHERFPPCRKSRPLKRKALT